VADFDPTKLISGLFGRFLPFGTFDLYENAGTVTMIDLPEESIVSGSWWYVDATDPDHQKFIGNFFLDSVGWVTSHDDAPVEILPAENLNIMTPWLLSGAVWSENAGWIALESLDSSYTGVTYTPGTQHLDGIGWSDRLGYIDFSWYNWVPTSRVFKNKVKILWAIGGNKVYNTEYYVGEGFNAAKTTGFINDVRKNVGRLTRALGFANINTTPTTTISHNNIAYYKNTTPTLGTRIWDNNLLAIIAHGGDIIIDQDIPLDADVEHPRAIIALKDSDGNGGNIYIGEDVKNIYTSIISEGSIYSWDAPTHIYNSDADKVSNLPVNQLYIFGSLIGRNTIGWGSNVASPVCPFSENTCIWERSLRYDLNYFRTFDMLPSHQSDKNGYDEYSIVLEYDPRILGDPYFLFLYENFSSHHQSRAFDLSISCDSSSTDERSIDDERSCGWILCRVFSQYREADLYWYERHPYTRWYADTWWITNLYGRLWSHP
jgi:hypothetical protein